LENRYPITLGRFALPPSPAAFLSFFVTFLFNGVTTVTIVTRKKKIVSTPSAQAGVRIKFRKGKLLSFPTLFRPLGSLRGIRGG
jgi:hypothetical protein